VEVRHARRYEWLDECAHGPKPVDARIVWSLEALRNLTSDGIGSLDLLRPTRWLGATVHPWWLRIDQRVELDLGESVDAKATCEKVGPIERPL